MRELLSSRITPLMRTVFPIIWTAMMAMGSIAVWFLPGDGENPPPMAVKFVFPLIAVAGAVMLFKLLGSLRTVWLEGDTLVVQAGREEWLIPLASVEEVKERRLHNPPSILVSARGPTGELVKVRFLAGVGFHLPFQPHPTATRLRAEVDAARAALPRPR
jgi:hypothetical protein